MDYSLIALIVMMVAVLVGAGRQQRRWRPGHPGSEYQRVISAAVFGLFLLVSGLVGWDLSYSRGWFQGTRWVDGPVWWQVGTGFGLLVLAGFWARRVPSRPAHRSSGPAHG